MAYPDKSAHTDTGSLMRLYKLMLLSVLLILIFLYLMEVSTPLYM